MVQKILQRTLFLCLLLSVVTFTAVAQPSKAHLLQKDPKVTVGQLENGLKYYIRPNAKPEKKVELRLVVNVGSIVEDEDQLGLAHFMEHMNFNGTKNFPKNELVSYLQSLGIEFGADLNAYTSFDETVYILPVPTDQEGSLESGFQVLEDWAHQALLTDKDIDDERGIVLEESRFRRGAEDRMLQKYIHPLLNNAHYADRLPIGTDEIIQNFSYETLRRFYKDWYRPNLMAVIVVGDISVGEAEARIKKHFAHLKNPSKERERKFYPVEPYSTKKAMVVADKEASSYQFILNYSPVKKLKQVTMADYQNQLVRSLFTSLLNKRLSDLTEGEQPPFSHAFVSVDGFTRGYEGFSAIAIPSASVKDAVDATVAELLKVQRFGFTETELELIKKRMLSAIEKQYNERDKTHSAVYAREYIRVYLQDEPYPGVENEYTYYQKMIPGITLQEVNQEAKKWLEKDDDFFALLTGNGKDLKMPTDMELLEMVDEAFEQEVEKASEKLVKDQMLAVAPVPGKIISSTKDKELGTTTYTLSNGVKVTTKKTDFKSDEILLSGVKKGGSGNYAAQDKQNVQLGVSGLFGGSVVEAMGYGDFTPNELKDFLAGKTVSLSTSVSEVSNQVSGRSSVKDLESLLQLNYLKLTSPRKDEGLAKGAVSTLKTQLMFLSNNPQVSFIDSFMSVYYNNSPLTPISIPKADDLDKIDLDRVLEIYRDEFTNASGFHFFLVGNIDDKQLEPMIEQYLASLPVVKGTHATFKDNGLRPIAGVNQFKFYKGSDPKSLILNQYYGEIPYSEDLKLRAEVLSEILNIKLIENLREEMGAIYGGRIMGSVKRYPYAHYTMVMQLPCGPENVDALNEAADEQIALIKTKGPESVDLQKVKTARLEKHREALKENKYWLDKLAALEFWQTDRGHFFGYEKMVNALSEKDIQETANLLFDQKNIFRAAMYPAN